jgi:hypothetical protein
MSRRAEILSKEETDGTGEAGVPRDVLGPARPGSVARLGAPSRDGLRLVEGRTVNDGWNCAVVDDPGAGVGPAHRRPKAARRAVGDVSSGIALRGEDVEHQRSLPPPAEVIEDAAPVQLVGDLLRVHVAVVGERPRRQLTARNSKVDAACATAEIERSCAGHRSGAPKRRACCTPPPAGRRAVAPWIGWTRICRPTFRHCSTSLPCRATHVGRLRSEIC